MAYTPMRVTSSSWGPPDSQVPRSWSTTAEVWTRGASLGFLVLLLEAPPTLIGFTQSPEASPRDPITAFDISHPMEVVSNEYPLSSAISSGHTQYPDSACTILCLLAHFLWPSLGGMLQVLIT